MKLLVLLLLAGYAAASIGDGLDRTADAVVRDLLGDTSTLIQEAEGDEDIKTELGKKLQELLDHILEKIKETVEHGKKVREETLEKLKEVRQELKKLGISIGDKAKELLQKIKDKSKALFKRILNRLGLKNDENAQAEADVFMRSFERMIQNAENDNDVKTELGKKLREHMDEILERIKDALEKGKTIKGNWIEKLKDLKEKMKENKIEIGEKAKELYEKLKEAAKDFWKNLLEKLGKDKRSTEVSPAENEILNFFRQLKKTIMKFSNKDQLKKKIEIFFGKSSKLGKHFIALLEQEGRKRILELINRFLGLDEERVTS